MVRRLWLGALSLALASVPLVAPPGHAAAECLASPTHALQDDANTGADAPDARDAAVPLPLPGPDGNGDLNAYFWGWLDPPDVPGADVNDWYSIALDGAGEQVMLDVVSNYSSAMALYYGPFQLDVYAPGAAAPLGHSTSDGGEISFVGGTAGVYDVHVYVEGPTPCPPASLQVGDPLHVVRNYGVYVGCHPFCVSRQGVVGAA
jgi:hypothetical protein